MPFKPGDIVEIAGVAIGVVLTGVNENHLPINWIVELGDERKWNFRSSHPDADIYLVKEWWDKVNIIGHAEGFHAAV